MKRKYFSALLALTLSISTGAVTPLYAGETLNAVRYEAENAKLIGTEVAKAVTGYSGTGYVTGLDATGDAIEFTVQVPTTGRYTLNIGYAAPYGYKIQNIYTNGGQEIQAKFDEISTFTKTEAGVVKLQAGTNTIKIVNSWGWTLIDYIELEVAPALNIPTDIPDTLVNPNATKETQQLMTYLTDIYGDNILSGQFAYTTQYTEIDAIYNATGKYPAVLGLDFSDYSPGRIELGANPGQDTDKAIEWWKNDNGLVTFCWHWQAPKGVDTSTDESKWGGFYTKNTTFDFSIGIADQNSEEYQLMIRDIDAIALELQRLEDEGVPILWRPLHEAAGGWFWWGAKGADNFKELWKLMYDRLVNVHGLDNLIWVWSAADKDWYPGDEYVDIIGEDIYAAKHSYDSQANKFMEALNYTEGTKLITLSENGVLTDPDQLIEDAIPWSWNCTWGGEFVVPWVGATNYVETYTSLDMLKKYYNHEYVLTKDELPDFLFKTHVVEQMKVKVTSPTAGQVFDCSEAYTPINLEATVENGEGTTITFLLNGENVGEGTSVAWTPSGTTTNLDGMVDYTVVAKVINAAGKAVSSEPVNIKVKLPVESTGGETGDKQISVVQGKTAVNSNEVKVDLQITNLGTAIDLSKLEIRYLFTEEGTAAQKYWCDHAALQMNAAPWYVTFTQDIKGTLVKLDSTKTGADYYLSIKFAGSQSFEKDAKFVLQSHVTKEDWSQYDQSNDYSYTNGVVVYYDGVLIYGAEVNEGQ